MTAILQVPPNWPLVWCDWASTAIKMPCPRCGTFGLVLNRMEGGGIKSLSCTDCGLAGLPAVQAAFDRLPAMQAKARAEDAKAHETAVRENHPHLQMTKAKRQAA